MSHSGHCPAARGMRRRNCWCGSTAARSAAEAAEEGAEAFGLGVVEEVVGRTLLDDEALVHEGGATFSGKAGGLPGGWSSPTSPGSSWRRDHLAAHLSLDDGSPPVRIATGTASGQPRRRLRFSTQPAAPLLNGTAHDSRAQAILQAGRTMERPAPGKRAGTREEPRWRSDQPHRIRRATRPTRRGLCGYISETEQLRRRVSTRVLPGSLTVSGWSCRRRGRPTSSFGPRSPCGRHGTWTHSRARIAAIDRSSPSA